MKKVKQILAITGIILLVLLYASTIICAVMDNSGTGSLFFASVVATVMIPALLWTYNFVYRLLKNHYGSDSHGETKEDSDSPSTVSRDK